MSYQVFISFKNLDENGVQTRDGVLADEVYHFLTSHGIKVFFSDVTLEKGGESDYSRAINEALDSATILVAVGTSFENLDSHWVRYEWDSFFNEIRSKRKPNGKIFTYVEDLAISKLPFALRQTQVFHHNKPGSREQLYNFICNALLKAGQPVTTADVHCPSGDTDTASCPVGDADSAPYQSTGHKHHRKVRLHLEPLEARSGLRARLTVQEKHHDENQWCNPGRFLLVCKKSAFRLGRFYKHASEMQYNDVVTLVHHRGEPFYSQWHVPDSRTSAMSLPLSRRQMDIIFENGKFTITWIKPDSTHCKRTRVYLLRAENGNEPRELLCGERYTLQDRDVLNLRDAIRFQFRHVTIGTGASPRVIGACLKRCFENGEDVKTVNLYDALKEKEYEHYYQANYLFPELVLVGGKGTDGISIDCPGLAKNRFKVEECDGVLKLIDLQCQDQVPMQSFESG